MNRFRPVTVNVLNEPVNQQVAAGCGAIDVSAVCLLIPFRIFFSTEETVINFVLIFSS